MTGTEIRHENENYKVIAKFLGELDNHFTPSLSQRVNIEQYAKKISQYADIFNLWYQGELIGSVAIYLNNKEKGFITSYAIKPDYQKKGCGKKLWEYIVQEADKRGIREIFLDVHKDNHKAQDFYNRLGFMIECIENDWIKMIYIIRSKEEEL